MPFSSRTGHLEPETPVDYSKYFVPERFTPLFYTPFYHELTEMQRRRYNQLHGCYCNEQIMFLERSVADPVLVALLRSADGSSMAPQLRTFLEEEERHTRMFGELNRLCLPRLYENREFFFLTVPRRLRAAVSWATRHPLVFPLFVWLMLLEEERAVFLGQQMLRLKEELEPHFVAVHRIHLADEIGHVQWDEEILDWLWPKTAALLRKANAGLLRWVIGEFFVTPKRANVRVLEELARELPELRPRLKEMRREFLALRDNPDWNLSLHSKATVPKTFARLEACPDLACLGEVLSGYGKKI
ncbi:MAG: diiron oxygenase [Candidatus Binatia bacterium]